MNTELTYLLDVLKKYKKIHGDKPLTILSLILFIEQSQQIQADDEETIDNYQEQW